MQRLVPELESRNECCSCYASFIKLEKALQKANEEKLAVQMRVRELEQLVVVVKNELKDANDLLLKVLASNPPSNRERDQSSNFHSHLSKFKTKLSSRKLHMKPSNSSARQINKQGSWRLERSSRKLVVDRIQRTVTKDSLPPSDRIADGTFLQMVPSDNTDTIRPSKLSSKPSPVERKDTFVTTSKNRRSSPSSNLMNGTNSTNLISPPVDSSNPKSKTLHSQSPSISSSLSPPCEYFRSIHRRLSTSLVIDGMVL